MAYYKPLYILFNSRITRKSQVDPRDRYAIHAHHVNFIKSTRFATASFLMGCTVLKAVVGTNYLAVCKGAGSSEQLLNGA